MVYCHNCGAENQDNAEFCASCGDGLYPVKAAEVPRSRRKKDDDCFGLPYGDAIWGLLCGSIIIIAGTSWMFGYDLTQLWSTTLGPFIVIFIGSLIILGAIYSITKKSRQ
ncbi:MAG: zinc-ribbon domain-containing protein [Candidatus Thorarchaeota archaeon]|jgi:hypothetical protein